MSDEEQKYIESDIKAVKEVYENIPDKRQLHTDTDSLKAVKEVYENMSDKRYLYFDTDSLKLEKNIKYNIFINQIGESGYGINTGERREDLCKFSKNNDNA